MAACGCSPLSVGVILFGPASYRTQLTGGQVFHTDDGPYFAIEAGTVIQVDFVPHQLDSSDTDDSSCSTDDDASGDDDLQRAADHPSTADETSPGVLSTLGSHHYWGIPSGSAGADAANPHVGGADALSYDGARFAALLPSVTEARVIKYSLCQTSNQCLPPGPGHYLRHAGPLPGVCPRHSYLPQLLSSPLERLQSTGPSSPCLHCWRRVRFPLGGLSSLLRPCLPRLRSTYKGQTPASNGPRPTAQPLQLAACLPEGRQFHLTRVHLPVL